MFLKFLLLCSLLVLATSQPVSKALRGRVPYRRRLYSSGVTEEPTTTTTTTTTTTPPPPPKPFKYAYAAGRLPNGNPDRYVEQEGDADGNIKGSYTYLDPNWQWRKVEYVAGKETGFQVVSSEPQQPSDPVTDPEAAAALLPLDTAEVAKAKARHKELFAAIAAKHREGANRPNRETYAVQQKRDEHAQEFARIAEEHARIAAEHSRLTSLAAQFGEIYEGYRR